MSIFTCLPSLLDFPTNPPTHPPLPRGVRRGAVWGGALVTRVMSGAAVLFQVTRVETIEFTRRVQLVWWDANAGVSLKNNFIICSERCSLADLDCLFQGRADIIKVPVRRVHFPFPEAHFFTLLITGIRGRAFIFCFYSLLAHGLESSILSACSSGQRG